MDAVAVRTETGRREAVDVGAVVTNVNGGAGLVISPPREGPKLTHQTSPLTNFHIKTQVMICFKKSRNL